MTSILPRLERLTRKYVALGAACVGMHAMPTTLVAQGAGLRILRIAPSDSGAPGSIISITFDRPVAGMLDHTVDAHRVMSVQPEVDGEYEWRDPATIRFVPRDPFTPGSAVSVSLDTAAIASGGARTGVRYQFPLHFRGARPLVLVVEGRVPTPDWPIGPLPIFRVLYSTTVNLDSVAQFSRLDFTRECGGSVALRPVRQRPVQPNDGPIILNAGGYDRDLIGDRSRRVVELQPVDSLRPNCLGVWQVASFDPSKPRDGWRFGVRTAPPFTVSAVHPCLLSKAYNTGPVCEPDGLSVAFSAQVADSEFARHVHTAQQLTRAAPRATTNTIFSIPGKLTPSKTYTVNVDSSLRDAYGRPIRGTTTFAVTAGDRAPGIAQQLGLITLPSSTAQSKIQIRTVNIDSVAMFVMRVPDSLAQQLLWTPIAQQHDFMRTVTERSKDIAKVVVPVRSRFNEETTVAIPIPKAILAQNSSAFVAIRFAIVARSVSPDSRKQATVASADSSAGRAPVRRPPVMEDSALYGLFAQFTSLRVHAKIAGGRGAIFVTDAEGKALNGASITLRGAGSKVYSTATSGNDGLATLVSSASQQTTVEANRIERDYNRSALRYLDVTYGSEKLIVPISASLNAPSDPDLSAWNYGANSGSADLMHATLTLDRDAFRPGEPVYAKLYTRYGISGAMTARTGDSVRFYFSQSRNQPGRIATLNAFGTAVDSLRIPDDATIGYASVGAEILRNGQWEALAGRVINVAEFRSPEFLVNAKSDDQRRVLGDTVSFSLDAKYLFGAPMSGAAVNWTATSYSEDGVRRRIPGTVGYSIGRDSWWESYSPPEQLFLGAVDSLDRNGHADLRIPTTNINVSKPTRINFSVAVTDVNNRVVTSSATAFVDAASFYVAAKDRNSSPYWKAGEKETIDAFVVRPDGTHEPNVPMRVSIIRRRWTPDSLNGFATGQTKWYADTVQSLTVNSTSGIVPVQFTPTLEGAYDVRFEARDEHARVASTNVGRWTSSSSYVASARGTSLALRVRTQHTDSGAFAIGDTATISFASPFAKATAWMTVEREGIVEQRQFPVARGVNSLRLPVTSRYAPNIYVGVTLMSIDGKTKSVADSAAELLRVGYTELRVDSTAHQLRVSVEPLAAKVSPGDSVQVRVRVQSLNASRDRSMRTEVALWAVDEGVLSLSGYKTPDILRLLDTRNGVSHKFETSAVMLPWKNPMVRVVPGSNLLLGEGDFGVSASPAPTTAPALVPGELRSLFRLTAFYIGSAVTDSSGLTTVHAKLPDNITTFRLMATAIGTDNQYGSGEASLLVTRTVVVRPSLPRFVRYGDSLVVAAVVNLRDRANAAFRVTSTVSGAALRGDSVRVVNATDTTGAQARFTIQVPEKSEADATRVSFAARENGGIDGDAIASTIPIRSVGSARGHSVTGAVRDSGSVSIILPGDIDPARSTVTVSLGSSPLVAMRSNYERLRAYSYYSTDFVLTSARSLLALSRAERLLNDRIVTRDSILVRHDLQTAVDALVNRWSYSGNFKYWSDGAAQVDRVGAADIGLFLVDVKRDNVEVPANIIRGMQQWANSELRSETWLVDTSSGSPEQQQSRLHRFLSERLALTRFLRESGDPNLPSENALMDQPELFAWEDRVLLAQLMSKREARIPQARAVLEDAWNDVTPIGNRIEIADSLRGYGAFPSHIRPAARLLSASVVLMPEYPLIGALVETVLQQGAAEQSWAWNSQDYGSAIEALSDVVSGGNQSGPSHITVRGTAGRVLFSRATRTANTTAGALANDSARALDGLLQTLPNGTSRLSLSLRVDADSSNSKARNAPVYFSVTVHEISRTRPVTPDIKGIVVERWYENYDDGKPIIEAREGQLVRVKLKITVPADRQFVAIEDPLPAGLEAVDLTLRTSNNLGPFAKGGVTQRLALSREQSAGPLWQNLLYGSWESGWWSPWEYKELHDDRVTYFARQLWTGSYLANYIARATTSGTFVRPPAHAEEMYNPAVQGRSDGGVFVIRP